MDPDNGAPRPPTEPMLPVDPDAYVAPEGSAGPGTPAPLPDSADAYAGPSATAAAGRRSGGRSGRRSAPEPGERRRGNTKWLWPVLGVLLVCCALSSCGALWGAGVFNGRAKTEAAFKAADVHWALAATELTKVNDTVDKFSKVDAKNVAGSLTKLATEGEKGVVKAKDQLAQAKAALAEVEKSKSKTTYLAAVAEADAALVKMQALFAYVKHLGKLYGLAASGKAKVVIGNANLSSAVRAANKGNYKDTKRYASRASDAYSAAANDFAAGNVLDKSAGFKETLAYTAKVKAEADVLAQVADAGAKNQVASYNTLAKKQADLQAQVNKMPQGAILENPKWANAALDDLLGSIKKHITQAEALHAAALKLLKAGD
jgi:hypothetical protein